LIVAGLVYVPRLDWQRSVWGYDIVQTATVQSDQPWTFTLPLRTTSLATADHNQWAGTIDIYTDPALTKPVTALTTTATRHATGVTAAFTSAWTEARLTDNLPNPPSNPVVTLSGTWPVGTYYVAERRSWFNHRLARPRVHVLTVVPAPGALGAPTFDMTVSQQGSPTFSWTRVPGATAYYIVKLVGPTADIIGTADAQATTWLAATQDRAWQNARQNGRDPDLVNQDFRALTSDGQACQAPATTLTFPQYVVVAAAADGRTALALPQDSRSLLAQVPVASAADGLARLAADAGADPATFWPATYPVLMGDCHTVDYPVTATALVANADQTWVTLSYAATGSPLTNRLTGSTDAQTYDTVLGIGRDQGLRQTFQRSVMEDLASMTPSEVRSYAAGRQPVSQAPPAPYAWQGSSDMVTYIAAHLWAGHEAIDMTAFVADPAAPLIFDATNEALLQNPYITDFAPIIGIWDNALYVNYEMTAQDRADIAERLAAKVGQVTGEILTPGMSETARAGAINDWVATHAVYDYAAADFATGEHTREDYLAHYPNAWDAEGVLLDGTGVCTAYATAFKLLADAAGLTTVNITGYADDTGIGHQWIKARLDGVWQVIDPTWNSNIFEQIGGDVRTYFGMSDAEADRMQLDSFVVNPLIWDYDAP
jgi:hypothetical protein